MNRDPHDPPRVRLAISAPDRQAAMTLTAALSRVLGNDHKNFNLQPSPRTTEQVPDREARSDPVSLTTLTMAFLTSGAAAALIKVIGQFLAQFKNSEIHFVVTTDSGREWRFSGENVTEQQANAVIEQFEHLLLQAGQRHEL